jgi:hypothetical protein
MCPGRSPLRQLGVLPVRAKGAGVAAQHLGHHLSGRSALHAEDSAGEVQGLLKLPDPLVLAGWQDLRRVAHR